MDSSYTFLPECPVRSLIGNITRVDEISQGPYGRTSYEVDCIAVQANPEVITSSRSYHSYQFFALIRIITTPRRLNDFFGEEIQEGDWVQLHVAPKNAQVRPIIFHSQLRENGYTEQSEGRLYSAEKLFSGKDIDPQPRSLGAAATTLNLASAYAAASAFPTNANKKKSKIKSLLKSISRIDSLVVHDVGQANFVTLLDKNGAPVGRFDVGWPISFNARTAPTAPSVSPSKSPVILSHWDFDHLHGFYTFPFLQNCPWITPIQALGPGQARIANRLADANRLFCWQGGAIRVGGLKLAICQGPNIMNDNGFILQLKLGSGKRALLVGDANYNAIQVPISHCDFLVVTHHGALFSGLVPQAVGPHALAIVSVGLDNVYRHPRDSALQLHRQAGWSLSATAKLFGQHRGDRQLI